MTEVLWSLVGVCSVALPVATALLVLRGYRLHVASTYKLYMNWFLKNIP